MDETNKTDNEIKTNEQSLFTLKEKQDVVKGFIRARIAGKVRIDYVQKDQMKEFMRIQGHIITDEQAKEATIKTVERMNTMIDQCTNSNISKSEQNKAIENLFQELIRIRGGDRIIGEFWDYELEKRLETLEQKVDSTINILTKEVRWLKEQMNV